MLGSSGSVIPLFQEQISNGGPITLTHENIIRYFMTIKEAVHLVLEASLFAKGGEVFLLDMGAPVRIIDLARKLIKLNSLTEKNANNPDGDIEIQIKGLRPGEKLYEETLVESNAEETNHPRIYQSRESENFKLNFSDKLNLLIDNIKNYDEKESFKNKNLQ